MTKKDQVSIRNKSKLDTRKQELEQILEPILTDPQRQNIVFDHETKQYYNKQTDIYLCDDDIEFFGLPPTQLVPYLTKPLTKSVAIYLLTHNK